MTWVIALPLGILFYRNFPEPGIFNSYRRYYNKISHHCFSLQEKDRTLSSDRVALNYQKSVTNLNLFFIKLDRYIFKFTHTMSGTFLIFIVNVIALGVLPRITVNSIKTPEPTVQSIFLGMLCSWFILLFLR